jgi:putative transposase
MSHSCVEIYLHLIFATKGRLPLIPSVIEERLYNYMRGIARKREVPFLRVNGMPDHIHILCKLHSSIELKVLMKEIKSYSSGWLKKEGVVDFAWQEGYGAFSCSVTHVELIKKYIDNQKKHHQENSLDQELHRLNKLWNTNWLI